tara:strand:+ start:2492 stop:3484 length:993 start_codon:yes stop_codon:yes gene_type:complete
MIKAAIIGTGIGIKHFEAIHKYKNAVVKIICETNKKKIIDLKKRFNNIQITTNEKNIFLDKDIKLVSIASYDGDHFLQIIECIKYNKNIIVEKPMCLKESQLKKIKNLLAKKPDIKMTSNLALRANSLFLNFKKNVNYKDIFYIEADYIWGRKEKLFEWRSKIKDYSITLGAAIHMIDFVMWLTMKRPINVSTFGNNLATRGTEFKKTSFIIYLFEFPGNVIVKISANAAGIYNHFHEVKIFQKNKTLVNNYLGAYCFEKKNKKTLFTNLTHEYPDKKNRKKLIQNFIDVLNNKKIKPIVTLKEQFDLMSVCFASDKSLKFNKKINIKYL